ncbi:hypothetical protein HLB23_18790 [Nocardia uniformis]|uniref:Uncharacterized protein n=1 Tax=Nocardia uniformis TaxID=53432 RepID=A0A849CAG4_9NOCA|nr:hypothetical protein [Nocardia uniformis]NNH71879.1 hypothetical protein [Nocardia uniformis]
MFETLKVGIWACVDDECPIRLLLHPEDDAATLVFGGPDGFELFLSEAALRNLLQVGTDGLSRLTTRH